MNPAEIVMDSVESNGMTKVIDFLAEAVCQPGKSAYEHSHGEVGAAGNPSSLNVAGPRSERRA